MKKGPIRTDAGGMKFGGSLSEAAKMMGEKGGQSKTPTKSTASRVNGRHGGRPRGS
jgi:hypothetical protein